MGVVALFDVVVPVEDAEAIELEACFVQFWHCEPAFSSFATIVSTPLGPSTTEPFLKRAQRLK